MKALAALLFSITFCMPALAADVVLARNEWTTVTKADFDVEIARIPKEQQFGFLASAERVARTVEAILINKTLAAQARAAKLDEDPAVKAEIASQVEKVLARARSERAEAQWEFPDFTKRAQEVYRANPGKFAAKDIIHTRHVLVDAKCRTDEAALARAKEARAELQAGKPFEEVARKYSDDPSVATNAGDLGPIIVDNLLASYVEAALAVKPGELTQPVRTPHGYHVIRLEKLQKGRQYPFDEVRESIVAEVREDWVKQQRKESGENILNDPKLRLEADNIQALKTNINAPAVAPPPPKRPG